MHTFNPLQGATRSSDRPPKVHNGDAERAARAFHCKNKGYVLRVYINEGINNARFIRLMPAISVQRTRR